MAKYDWVVPALSAAAMGYSAYSQSRNQRRDRELRQQENELDRRYQAAVRESELNPYRHHLSQAQTLGALDLIARGDWSTPQITVPGVTPPTITGGFEYAPNPDLQTAAKRLQQQVASGRGAPSMADPNNWGQTGAIDLNAPMGAPAGGAVPRGSGGGALPSPPNRTMVDSATLLAGIPRRNEGAGGVWQTAAKGASAGAHFGWPGAVAGALGGALVGAFTKNAKTAATDISVDDARRIIAQRIQQLEGRTPSAEEVTEILRGQGWRPGHRWVGEAGLLGVLRNLEQNAAQATARDLSAGYDGLFS